MKALRFPALLCACVAICTTAAYADNAPATVTQDSAGVTMHYGEETLRISVCGPGVLHVVAGPGAAKSASPAEPWILQPCTPVHFDFSQNENQATLRTADLRVNLRLATGQLTFLNAAGQQLLAESDRRTRVYTPDTVNGEKVNHVSDRFQPAPTEGFYGLGQHQSGVFNYRGNVVELA